ncbi:MAG: glycosyltransferase family 2 protein [Bryobacterales bacterium]|nr:glycosyltransferase family 2 protein [Bryobacterales bacterium]
MEYSCVTVMPVYNEAACVERVCLEWLERMRAIGGALLVINDGSHDDTPRILNRLAAGESDLIVVHQVNGGHGAAIMNGYHHALGLNPGWLFQVDSDGEMPASLFPQIWAQREQAAFVMGRRSGRQIDPLRLRLSNAHRQMLALLFGVRVSDPNIPFRLMRAGDFRTLLEAIPDGLFAPNVFLTLLAARAGILADGPEVPLAPRDGGVPSIRGWGTMRVALRCAVEMVRFRQRHW